ncbi:MAG: hypothetical protein A2X46_04810 [Lentisphaerae bacterium GWF2_57_35]|nr:MAG: hypothetical protein A2X46_04810 [Lentisphaerae bacterium GWF2_57_35]
MHRWLNRIAWLFLLVLFTASNPAAAQTLSAHTLIVQPILGTNERHHVEQALHYLNMTPADLAFEKDIGKPLFALKSTRALLAHPMELSVMGDRVFKAAAESDPAALWSLMASLLEVTELLRLEDADLMTFSPDGVDGFSDFLARAAAVETALNAAFNPLSDDERGYLSASYLAGAFYAEDREPVRLELMRAGMSSQQIDRVIQEGLRIDPEPFATNGLALMLKIDTAQLLQAGQQFQESIYQLAGLAAAATNWPAQPVEWPTPQGPIVIGSLGDDVYTNAALIVLDPGGNDRYEGSVGAANGLLGRPLAAIVDLGGDDLYESAHLTGAGTALFGAAVVWDGAGDDVYRAGYMGQGAAVHGAAWMEDRAGDDVYRARAHAQGAAQAGVACLLDGTGNDRYDLGYMGQAYAGVLAVGLLVDRHGNDRYMAGGLERDYDHNEARFVSLAQGFAIGLRPYAGGGVAALVDLDGSDSYLADIFAQGVSYWYSAGMLLDAAGNDTYSMYHYGQGSGIHLSSGLLVDGAGDDVYTGYVLSQGNAHDYAVGLLVDRAGNDTYTADQHSQGRAINNSLAVLIDSAGNDAYFARQANECQGIGNDGDKREYGSLALLMDLAGRDRYSCGARDGARLLRPNFGIVYDVKNHETE